MPRYQNCDQPHALRANQPLQFRQFRLAPDKRGRLRGQVVLWEWVGVGVAKRLSSAI
ncbi:MAG: hypothetical protein U0694_18725 [Anaerolineae bacterium]